MGSYVVKLSETNAAANWLAQFQEPDREFARALLDEMLLVSRDKLVAGLHELIGGVQAAGHGRKVALYAEQPIPRPGGRTAVFFKSARTGRATGAGRQPVVAN